ncbi:pseudouridine-5'-phosphatase-like [Oppia nitens]|uniref:pseudouridine-5'-phosphatase-like n=1 Tax=Oppia nitens TaxID=1686743 RepID=UPI0023DB6718|nr:pseudouridine-5'-phosphatase-like [Oppia nitens]
MWGLDNLNVLLKPLDKQYSLESYRPKLGMHVIKRCELIVSDLVLPYTAHQLLDKWLNQCITTVTDIQLMPGAERLVKHLSQNEIPMAIGSAGKKREFMAKSAHFGDLFATGKYFRHIVHGDDQGVEKLKPEPDVFNVCNSAFNPVPDPQNVLVFEDNLIGITAANKAGMRTVLVNDQRFYSANQWSDSGLNIDLIINSLDEFEPQLFGLPSFI